MRLAPHVTTAEPPGPMPTAYQQGEDERGAPVASAGDARVRAQRVARDCRTGRRPPGGGHPPGRGGGAHPARIPPGGPRATQAHRPHPLSAREHYRLGRAAPEWTRLTSAMPCRQKSYVMPSENACGLVPVKQVVPLPIRLIPGLAVKVGVPPSLQSHVTPCPPGPKA